MTNEEWGISADVKVRYVVGITGLKMAFFDCPHCLGLKAMPLKDDFVFPESSADSATQDSK